MEEKHAMIAAHNEAKSSLISEIKTLRKSLVGNNNGAAGGEHVYAELRRAEASKAAMEEEFVKTTIHNDALKVS